MIKQLSLLIVTLCFSIALHAQVSPSQDSSASLPDGIGNDIAKPVDPEPQPRKEVFVAVEQMPEFPGGQNAMMTYIGKNMRYPQVARELNLQGKVYLSFIVDDQGNVFDVNVLRAAINDLPDADPAKPSPAKQAMINEAVRVVRSMPKWMPGKQNGRAVNCKFTLPISFVIK